MDEKEKVYVLMKGDSRHGEWVEGCKKGNGEWCFCEGCERICPSIKNAVIVHSSNKRT